MGVFGSIGHSISSGFRTVTRPIRSVAHTLTNAVPEEVWRALPEELDARNATERFLTMPGVASLLYGAGKAGVNIFNAAKDRIMPGINMPDFGSTPALPYAMAPALGLSGGEKEYLREQRRTAAQQRNIGKEQWQYYKEHYLPYEKKYIASSGVVTPEELQLRLALQDLDKGYERSKDITAMLLDRYGISTDTPDYERNYEMLELARRAAEAGVSEKIRTATPDIINEKRARVAAAGRGMPLESSGLLQQATSSFGGAASSLANLNDAIMSNALGKLRLAADQYEFEQGMRNKYDELKTAQQAALWKGVGDIAGTAAMALPFLFL